MGLHGKLHWQVEDGSAAAEAGSMGRWVCHATRARSWHLTEH